MKVLGVLLTLSSVLLAGESKPAPADDRVVKIVAALSHDDFEIREKAERDLSQLPAAALPSLQKALEQTTDEEVRVRIKRALPKLAIEVNNDPGELSNAAIAAANTGQLQLAAAAYRKIERLYKGRNSQSTGPEAFAENFARAGQAARLAELMDVVEKCGNHVSSAFAQIHPDVAHLETPDKKKLENVELRINDLNDLVEDLKIGAETEVLWRQLIIVVSFGSAKHSAEFKNGRLIVMTTPELHEIVARFLEKLRDTR